MSHEKQESLTREIKSFTQKGKVSRKKRKFYGGNKRSLKKRKSLTGRNSLTEK